MRKSLIISLYVIFMLILTACQTNTTHEPGWIASYKKTKQVKDVNLASENLWSVIGQSFELNNYADNPRVKEQIAFYSKNKRFFDKTSANAEPYLYHVFDEIKKANLPSEMIILPMVESSFDPHVSSSSRATGIWQFVASTGRMYGLKQASNYDGRRDIEASTRAAVQYLQRLNQEMNGDWLLTLAAYNSGEGAVKKAIETNQRQGKKTDYFSLKLSHETQIFVPRILAIQNMLSDPERYNIKLNFTPTRPYFAGVTLPHNASFTQLASASETSLEELKILNPGYAKTAKIADKDYTFLIPADKTKQFAAASLPIPTMSDVVTSTSGSTSAKSTNTNKVSYRIKSGDTLSKIAKQFSVSISDIKKWNPVNANKTKLALGDVLYVYPRNKYSLKEH